MSELKWKGNGGAKNSWGVLVTTTAKTTLHHCTCWKVSKEKRGGRLPSLKVMMICKQFNQPLECSIWGFHYFMFSPLYSWGDIHDEEEFEGIVSNDKDICLNCDTMNRFWLNINHDRKTWISSSVANSARIPGPAHYFSPLRSFSSSFWFYFFSINVTIFLPFAGSPSLMIL